MSESALHLKLDRILAGQDQILNRIIEQDETTAILTAAITTLNDAIGTQTEVINRLTEALSEEAGSSDLHEAIKSIATSLKQIKEDGANMHVMLGRLAPSVAQAAQRCGVHGHGRWCRYPARGTDMSGPRTPGWIYVLAVNADWNLPKSAG